MDQNNVSSNPVGSYNNRIASVKSRPLNSVHQWEGGEMTDIESRLRAQERATAVLEATLSNMDKVLTDIQAQIKEFLEQTRATATLDHDVRDVKEDIGSLVSQLKTHGDWIEKHKASYSKLMMEHEICHERREEKSKAGWWRERLGRLVDTAVIGLIVFLLFLFRAH